MLPVGSRPCPSQLRQNETYARVHLRQRSRFLWLIVSRTGCVRPPPLNKEDDMKQRARTEDQSSRTVADAGDARRFRSVARALGLAGVLGIGFLTGFGCGADS